MIEEKEIDVNGKTYILSKFPAVAGREIITNYPLSGLPKVGDYKTNESIMLKLMSYVAIPRDGAAPLRLTTRELIDNHIKDWETLVTIEKEMMVYNCSFFQNGRASTFFDDIAQNLPAWILKTLTGLSAQLSQKEKRRSKS